MLNFLIENNKARILEDPRITTISGRTASLRAGETVNILTTTGGGTGTVATTQVQSFQTGVTLDITPVVNDGDYITVTLHPTVNSIAGISAAGVPNIQTRDTTTTVGLHDGQTIVIAGLIEDIDSRTVQKIPFLGDLPLIGRALFTYQNVQQNRNELIVTVTPHIVRPGDSGGIGETKLGIPHPDGLPTLPPNAQLPPPRRVAPSPAQPETTPSPPARRVPQPITVPTPAGRSPIQYAATRRRGHRAPIASSTRHANPATAAVGVLANQRLHVWPSAPKQLRRSERRATDILRPSLAVGRQERPDDHHCRHHLDQRGATHLRSELAAADGVAAKHRAGPMARKFPVLRCRATHRPSLRHADPHCYHGHGHHRCLARSVIADRTIMHKHLTFLGSRSCS